MKAQSCLAVRTKSAAVRDEDVNKTDEPKASPESTPPSKRETKHESAQTPSKADKQASEGAEEVKLCTVKISQTQQLAVAGRGTGA